MTTPHAGSGIAGLAAARLWAAARFPYLASGIFGARVVAAPGIGTVAVDPGWRLWADPELTANWTAAELGSVLVHHVCHLLRDEALQQARLPGRQHCGLVSLPRTAEPVRAAAAVQLAAGLPVSSVGGHLTRSCNAGAGRGEVLLG